MSVPAPGAGPRTIVRSVRGASHERSGTPNQDAGGAVTLADGAAVLAIADGHGDPLHRRSDRGSRFAVEAAIEIVSAWLAAAAALDDAAAERSAADLPARLMAAWHRRVAADLAADPPANDDDPGLQGDMRRQVDACPALLYGSTLAAAGLAGRLGLFVQIGDGDILVLGADGAVIRLAPGRRDLPTNVTESLCQPDAAARFRLQLTFHGGQDRPSLVMLSTDGYVNSYEDDRAFFKVASDLGRYLREDGPDAVAERLAPWLAQTSQAGSGDDITLALLWQPPDAALRPVERSAGRRAIPLVAALLVALAAAPVILSTAFPEAWTGTGIPALVHGLGGTPAAPSPAPVFPPPLPSRWPYGEPDRR